MQTSERYRIAKYIVFLVTLALNVLLAVGVVFIPKNLEGSVLISITMSFVLTLVVALEELKYTLQERDEELKLAFQKSDEEVLQNFQKIDDYLLLDKLYRSIRIIGENSDDLFQEQVRAALFEFSLRLKEAEFGELTLDTTSTISIANKLSISIQKTLDATMLWDKTPLTGSEEEEYLNNLATAIRENNVKVRRLFIIQPDVENDDAFRQRVSQDKANGVTVKYLYLKTWLRQNPEGSPADFGIWDKKRVWAYKVDPDSELNQHLATLYNNKDTVESYQKKFDANWLSGKKL